MPYTPEKHPIAIRIGKNHVEHCWDLMLQVGGFRDEAQAKAYAKRCKEFLEAEADGNFSEVQ